MRMLLSAVLLAGIPAQARAEVPDSAVGFRPRSFTLLAGFGNAMGWFGLQGEKYFAGDRISGFAGLGYTLAVDEGDASGVTGAVGARGYTPGRKHRGFLELSVSQLTVEQACFDACRRKYGPGVQAGYQFVTRGGFTLLASVGLGYAPGMPEGDDKVSVMGGFGLGYSWRR